MSSEQGDHNYSSVPPRGCVITDYESRHVHDSIEWMFCHNTPFFKQQNTTSREIYFIQIRPKCTCYKCVYSKSYVRKLDVRNLHIFEHTMMSTHSCKIIIIVMTSVGF